VGESDPIDRPDQDPADAAGGVSHEGGDGARPALTAAVAPTTAAGGGVLPSEQLRRLADTAAAVIALPVPAVDHERALPPEALARVLDAVEASTATATKKAYRSDWQRFAAWAGRRRFPRRSGGRRAFRAHCWTGKGQAGMFAPGAVRGVASGAVSPAARAQRSRRP
jgi:hypothetical protein